MSSFAGCAPGPEAPTRTPPFPPESTPVWVIEAEEITDPFYAQPPLKGLMPPPHFLTLTLRVPSLTPTS